MICQDWNKYHDRSLPLNFIPKSSLQLKMRAADLPDHMIKEVKVMKQNIALKENNR